MIVKPAVVYESETWTSTERDMGRLNAWDRKVWRRIYGLAAGQGMWRIRINQEMWDLNKDLDRATGI